MQEDANQPAELHKRQLSRANLASGDLLESLAIHIGRDIRERLHVHILVGVPLQDPSIGVKQREEVLIVWPLRLKIFYNNCRRLTFLTEEG